MEDQVTSDNELSIKSILVSKENNSSTNPKSPAGFIYLKDHTAKFTVWSKTELEKLVENGEYKVVYTEKDTPWGKQYTIRDIIDLNMTINTDNFTYTKQGMKDLEDVGADTSNLKLGDGEVPWELMGIPIKLDETVTEIRMPRKVKNYLIQLKGGN